MPKFKDKTLEKNGLRTENPDPPRKVLGESGSYRIRKFGLYEYQLVRTKPDAPEENVDVANTFAVVASNLADRLWREISGGA